MSHLSFEETVALAESADRAPGHVDCCQACADEVATMARVLSAARADRSPEPPQTVLDQAYRLFTPPAERPGLAARLTEWIGELTLDSGLAPLAMAGARGAEPTQRQLLFETERLDIDLSYPRAAGPVTVRGQALAGAVDDADERLVGFRAVKLAPLTPSGEVQVTSTDADGSFALAAVARGPYELRFELDDGDVVIRFAVEE